MANVRASSRWTIEIVRTVLILAIVLSIGAVYSARGDSHDQTYYACLFAGSLSQVGTTPPSNCGRGEQISWNSQGVPGEDASALLVRERQLSGRVTGGAGTITSAHSCPFGHRIISGGVEIDAPGNATTTMSYLDFDGEAFRFRAEYTGPVEFYTTIVCIADPILPT